jgi:hypothetical protein
MEYHISEPVEYWKSDLPTGTSGDCRLERFSIRPLDPDETLPENAVPDFARRRPGTYTRLFVNEVEMMTDLYEEWWSQRAPIEQALTRGGRVLISGLGLGLIIESMLRPENSPVTQITVLEASAGVIDLVGTHMLARYADRLTIHHTDAFAWDPPPGERFSVVWHDIWPNPYHVPPAEIESLQNRFAALADWQDCWTDKYFQ